MTKTHLHNPSAELAEALRALLPYAENEAGRNADAEKRDGDDYGSEQAWQHVNTAKEKLTEYDAKYALPITLSGRATDVLIGLIEIGPLWDGDLPSKSGRDELINLGLATRIFVSGTDGHQAATPMGAEVFRRMFGNAETVREAMENRRALKR